MYKVAPYKEKYAEMQLVKKKYVRTLHIKGNA